MTWTILVRHGESESNAGISKREAAGVLLRPRNPSNDSDVA